MSKGVCSPCCVMVLLFDTNQATSRDWRFPFYYYERVLGRNLAIQNHHDVRKKCLACVNILIAALYLVPTAHLDFSCTVYKALLYYRCSQ